MKNLKKLVSVMVTVAMLISSLAAVSVSADYNDVDATNSYYKAIKVLSGLGIVKGDDEGNFNPTNDIKRSEAVALVCRMVGEDALASAAADAGFDDVPADHWAAGYIAWGVASEVVKGVGDNKFDPDAPVKFQDIIVMIARVTGYERIANRASFGGYPTGYLKVASQYGLLDNGIANYAGAKAATREVVAQALYNGLTMPLVNYTSYGENPEDDRYVIYNGQGGNSLRTTLTYTGKVYKVKADVKDTAKVNADLRADADNHKAVLTLTGSYDYDIKTILGGAYESLPDDITVYVGDTDVADYLGYTVEAYIAWNEDLNDWELLVAVVDTKSVVTETVSANIVSFDSAAGLFKYKADIEDSKATEIDTKKGAALTVYYNGRVITEGIDAAVKNADSVTFMGKKNEDYSKIFVTKYVYKQVEKVRAADLFIKFDGGSLLLDKEERNDETFVYNLYDAEGNAIAIEDIKEGDILNIVAPLGGTLNEVDYMDIYVSNATVEGMVNGKDESLDVYAIGGEYYKSLADIKMGDEGIFYLTIDGKIFASEAVSALSRNYAILLAAEADEYMGSYVYDVQLYTVDGEVNTYKLASSVKVYAETVETYKASNDKLDDLYDIIATAVAGAENEEDLYAGYADRFVTFKTNAAGEINELRFAKNADFVAKAAEGSYKADTEVFAGNDIGEESVLFVVPGIEKSNAWYINAEEIEIISYDALDEDDKYAYTMFNYADEDYIGATVLYEAIESPIKHTHLAVVKSVAKGLDAEANEVTKYTFVEGTDVVTLAVDPDYVTDLKAGDVFRYTVDADGEINKVQVIYNGTTFNNQGLTYDELDKNDIAIVYNKIWKISNGKLGIGANENELLTLRLNDTEGNTYASIVAEDVPSASAVKAMIGYDGLMESYEGHDYYVIAIIGESGRFEDCVQIVK
ncbi:MAG: S-layer homology domain-containing protein [Clostridia bacterium]|nr:S-layer homology domain-containing protein [Clostridia bacterium]